MKKTMTYILTLCMCLALGVALTACDFDLKDPDHTHTYETEWSHDDTYHWHACEDKTCSDTSQKAEHTFENNVCSVCGHQIEIHTHSFTELMPEDKYLKLKATCTTKAIYYKSCACGEIGQTTFEYGDVSHSWEDKKCSICGEQKPSSGLKYTLVKNGSYYSVSMGFCDDTHVYIPATYNGLPVKSIEWRAFYGCETLESVTIPDSVTSISCDAFSGCVNLKNVILPLNLEHIETGTFAGCENLTDIAIPNNVRSIGSYAFAGCAKLSNLTLGDNVKSIGSFAFQNCAGLTEFVIPDNVVNIASDAFSSCIALESVTIGDGLKEICDGTFSFCEKLHTITIGKSVSSIGGFAFRQCKNLMEIVIPDNVTFIGEYAFQYCVKLERITLSDSVNYIGFNAFDYCVNLKYKTKDELKYLGNDKNPYLYLSYRESNTITSANIDDNCKLIGYSAFEYCFDLTEIIVPDGVTQIGALAFIGCQGLKKVKIGSNVEIIDDYAFKSCNNLTDVIIPNGVTRIGAYAFKDCISLTNITIGNNITSVGVDAFLNTAYYNATNNWVNNVLFIDDCLIVANKNISGRYVMPEGTRIVADDAFRYCDDLVDIIIPNSVTHIGDYAFSICENLSSVVIGEGVIEIGSAVFAHCKGLTNIIIPDSVKNIGEDAFRDCSALEKVTIGSGVAYIGDDTFFDCNKLKTINYTGTINDWVNICFDGYYSNPLCNEGYLYIDNVLQTDIKVNAEQINDYAFFECIGLDSITIGNEIKKIGYSALYNYANTTSVFYCGSPDAWKEILIDPENYFLSNLYYYSENEPMDTIYRYWRYINGEIVLWNVE